MENLFFIKEVGAYSERQYQKQDGTFERRCMTLTDSTW